jgi:hypothetical protein
MRDKRIPIAGDSPIQVRNHEPHRTRSWIFECHKCKAKFEHGVLARAGMLHFRLPLKPNFPPETVEMECPNCGTIEGYKFSELSREF